MADAVNVFPPGQRITDTDGVPIPGATIEFYDAGTTNPKTVYSDAGLSTSLGSVVHTDSAGYPVDAQGGTAKILVYTGNAAYKIVIKDGNGVTVAPHDDVPGAPVSGSGGGGSGITEAEADFRYVRNPTALPAITNIASNDILGLWDTSASANAGITWANFQSDILSEWRTAGHIYTAANATTTFQQTSAPTGWTKQTTHNNKALRIVSGTASTGGTVAFDTAFASKSVTGTIGGTTLVEATTPAHTHSASNVLSSTGIGTTSGATGVSGTVVTRTTDSFGGSGSHTHSFTGTAINLDVQYVDIILAVKA